MGFNSVDTAGLHSFSRCCLPNLAKSREIPRNSDLKQFKVIKGHNLDANRKRMYNYFLVINSYFDA